ncbi:MAG: TonB family protein [Deltaproteobacteria bacterium]|jgi:TonB family protein|nr:TonB family protein [Deltaproteobacteria bacterium]
MLLSFLAALCLHALIAALAVYWPVNSRYKPNLNLPVLNLSQMTIGGKAPPVKSDPEPTETAALPPVAPTPPATQEDNPALVPKMESLGQTEQQEALRTEAPVEAVAPEKPADPPKPADKPKPADRPGAEVKPRPAAKPGPEEILRRELEQARLLAAIESARAESAVEDDKRNATAQGSSYSEFLGDGVGVLAGYRESVISRIKPHFITRPRADGKVFEMRVILDIAENGTVTRVTVVSPSEDSTFDQNVMRAINDAGAMEPPPSSADQRVPLIFTSDMYIG